METPSQMWARRELVSVAPVHEAPHQRATFGEHLVDVPVHLLHDVEHAAQEFSGNVLVEQVAHGVHEDEPGPPPLFRLPEAFRAEREVEARFEGVARNVPEAFREAFRIAVVAAGAQLGASGDRIPGSVGPLDGAVVGHVGDLSATGASMQSAAGRRAEYETGDVQDDAVRQKPSGLGRMGFGEEPFDRDAGVDDQLQRSRSSRRRVTLSV